jgi:hypothetical protein
MTWKYSNKENTRVSDGLGHDYKVGFSNYKKHVQPWLDEGNDIETYKTDIELELDAKKEREQKRDEIINQSPVILYQGNYYDMSEYSRTLLSQGRGFLVRGNSYNWKVQDAETGEKKRVSLGITEYEKFEDAIAAAIDVVHVQADTEIPTNPWPLEVI